MRKIHKQVPVLFQPYEWLIKETEFKEETNNENETIFSLANGYLGIRGFFEEGFYGSLKNTSPTVMINGIYEYYPITYNWCRPAFPKRFQSIVNNVNPIDVSVYLDGEKVFLNDRVKDYSRTLDMKNGELVRKFTYITKKGKFAILTFHRFVSQTEKHLLAVKIEIEVDKDVVIEIKSSLKPFEKYMLASLRDDPKNWEMQNPYIYLENSVEQDESYIAYRTKKSNFVISCSVTDNCYDLNKNVIKNPKSADTIFNGVSSGRKITYTRFCSFVTSRDTANHKQMSLNIVRKAKEDGYDMIFNLSKEYWHNFWDTADIQIEGDDLIQQGIRFALFMVNQSTGKDGTTNIPANGLTGATYGGQTFWDTEIFMMPMFLYSHPEIVKQLLMYRYYILPKAKDRAKEMDEQGALYSWSTINGEECSHVFEAATAQYHINADIAYAISRYYETTEDWDFMKNYGVEILLETAKCLSHRGNFIDRKGGRFCINCVCGPDEYNPVVDNNLYTNYLTKKHFEFTLYCFDKLEKEDSYKANELREKCKIDDSELDRMRKAADKMYLAYDKENDMYMQDDNFIYKDPINIDLIPIEKLPLLVNMHPLNLWRYQVIKQADIVLLMGLYGNEFSKEMKKKIFDFYESHTIHDSSLSSGVHSIVACNIGYEEDAYGYLKQSCRMDLDNVNRNVAFGVHAACMGSTYMIIVNGYAGLSIYDGTLHFEPKIPEKWNGYSFNISFRNSLICVSVRKEKTIYTLKKGNGIVFYHKNKKIKLDENNREMLII